MAELARLRWAEGSALAEGVEAFLAERDLAPTSRRVYRLALRALVDELGPGADVGGITTRQLAAFLRRRYAEAAPKTWNRVVATLGSFFAYCARQGWVGASPAAGLERRKERLDKARARRTRAIPAEELERFLTQARHPLRERLFWRMLYETAARAGEILLLDVTDLDLANRRATVLGKGGDAEPVGWDTATARLLPRYLAGRNSGPLFLAAQPPAPTRQPARGDVDPASGLVRLSYRRAAELFSESSGGWTLHQLRHSRLTHLAEAGVDLPLLMAKSRHASIRTLGLYARPTFEAVAAATARLDAASRRRSKNP